MSQSKKLKKMPETRRFAQGLKRRTSTVAESNISSRMSTTPATFQSESNPIIPVNYEDYIEKNSDKIKKDPLQKLVLFPKEVFEVIEQPRKFRTEFDTVPQHALVEINSLMVEQCIQFYKRDKSIVKNKYKDYASGYQDLPNKENYGIVEKLPEQKFEIDEDLGEVNIQETQKYIKHDDVILHTGWLYLSPVYLQTGLQMSISNRNFKKRFFVLQEFADCSHILNYYKDEKNWARRNPKGAIYLETCVAVVMSSRTRKPGFEVKTSDNTTFLAAETDVEASKWVHTINHALQRHYEAVNRDKIAREDASQQTAKNRDEDLELSASTMHPQLMKYAKETDHKNMMARQLDRCDIFRLFPDFYDTFNNKQKKYNV